jgi:hypothetical protein
MIDLVVALLLTRNREIYEESWTIFRGVGGEKHLNPTAEATAKVVRL